MDKRKMNSKDLALFGHIVSQACTDIKTVSERNKTGLHITHVTWNFQQAREKWFWSLCHYWGEQCPRLHWYYHWLQTDQNETAHDPRHLGVWIVTKKWLRSPWHYWGKPCLMFAIRLTLSPCGPKQDCAWPTSPRGSNGHEKNEFEGCSIIWAYRVSSLHWG